MNSLEMTATDDLLDELLHRFDHAMFSGAQTPIEGENLVTRRWVGNPITCVGLAQVAAFVITADLESESEWIDDDSD